MSDMRTYFGPYAECKIQIVEVDDSRWECPNHPSWLGLHSPFCSQCGSRAVKVPIKVKARSVIHYMVRDEMQERFGLEDLVGTEIGKQDIWLANVDFGHICRIDEDDEVAAWRSDTDRIIEADDFRERFKKSIDLLIEKYGESNVTIRWGLVRYSM